MKRYLPIISLLACVVIVGFGCSRATKPGASEQQVIDRNAILMDARNQGLIMDTGEIEHMKDPSVLIVDQKKVTAPDASSFSGVDFRGWTAAALADVTSGTSFGLAHLKMLNGQFRIAANFGGLTQPTDGSYYQAWLVKRGDGMKIIDLGKLNATATVLTYASNTDLAEYDFFVVTLQSPNSTIPGEHILEGVIR